MKLQNKMFISAVFGCGFFIFAILVLSNGHLHEDAYILFQYSKKLATGHGIVFDGASGPTEGATDFLWMVALAVISRVGLDLGTAAAFLNGLGLSVTVFIILSLASGFKWLKVWALLMVLFSGGMAAALGGFSTLAYGGIFSLYVFSLLTKKFGASSFLAILIPLFRPDGLLLVAGGLLVTYFLASKDEIKKLVLYLIPAVIVGGAYFIWRLNYFDTLLPLPLLVKSKTDYLLAGVGANYGALRWYLLLLLPLAVLLIRRELAKIEWRKLFLIGSGPFLLLVALSFAHQSQNVGGRFQYPIVLSLIFIYIISMRELRVGMPYLLVPPAACLLFGANIIYQDVRYLTNDDYINYFPQILKQDNFKVDSIAITEAGRFPFWYDARVMIDLVGLNSAKVVETGPFAVLADARPSLIFVHHAGRYDLAEFDTDKEFFITQSRLIKLRLTYVGKNPVLIAPEAALRFAADNGYYAVPVRYGFGGRFSHVYFLAPELDVEAFMYALQESLDTKLSYFESVRNLYSIGRDR